MASKPSASIGRRIVVGMIVFVCIFLGIKYFSGVRSIDAEEFSEIFQEAGYITTDTTETLSQEWKAGSMLKEAVSINEDNI